MSLMLENNRLEKENQTLRIRLAASENKQKALLVERDFFVEQGRSLQNQLQLANRMHADLFDQLGRGTVTEESIANNLAMASEELRQPLATVEAVRALTASMDQATQGEYSLRNADSRQRSIQDSRGGYHDR